jgi:hypothetical protein
MGLDVLELVMEVEESFDVVLPDAELGRVDTVGDLYHFVLRQRGVRAARPCLSSVAFYRVRRALMEGTGAARRGVRPRTRLEELLPVENRHALWERFRRASGPLRPHGLAHPGWIAAMIGVIPLAFFGAGAAALVATAAGVWGGHLTALWAALFLATVLVAREAYRLSEPLALCFPRGYVTVGDLVRDLLAHNYAAVTAEAAPAGQPVSQGDEREVWDALRRILGTFAGVEPDRLTEATRFRDAF